MYCYAEEALFQVILGCGRSPRWELDNSIPGNKPKQSSKTIILYDANNYVKEKTILFSEVPYEGFPKQITQKFAYTFDKNNNKLSLTTQVIPENGISIMLDWVRPKLNFSYTYTKDKKLTQDKTNQTSNSKYGIKNYLTNVKY